MKTLKPRVRGPLRESSKPLVLANPTEVCEFITPLPIPYFELNQYVSGYESDDRMGELLAEVHRCDDYLRQDNELYTVEKHHAVVIYCKSLIGVDGVIRKGDGSKSNPFTSLHEVEREIQCIAIKNPFSNQHLYFKVKMLGTFEDTECTITIDGTCVRHVHILIEGADDQTILRNCSFSHSAQGGSYQASIHLYFSNMIFESSGIAQGYVVEHAYYGDYFSVTESIRNCTFLNGVGAARIVMDSTMEDSGIFFNTCLRCTLTDSDVSTEPCLHGSVEIPPVCAIMKDCTLTNMSHDHFTDNYILICKSTFKCSSSITLRSCAFFSIDIVLHNSNEFHAYRSLFYRCTLQGNTERFIAPYNAYRVFTPCNFVNTDFDFSVQYIELAAGLLYECTIPPTITDGKTVTIASSVHVYDMVNVDMNIAFNSGAVWVEHIMAGSNIHIEIFSTDEQGNSIGLPGPAYAEDSSVSLVSTAPMSQLEIACDYTYTETPYKNCSYTVKIPEIEVVYDSTRPMYICDVRVSGLHATAGTRVSCTIPDPIPPKCTCGDRAVAIYAYKQVFEVGQYEDCGTVGRVYYYLHDDYSDCVKKIIEYDGVQKHYTITSDCEDEADLEYTESICD